MSILSKANVVLTELQVLRWFEGIMRGTARLIPNSDRPTVNVRILSKPNVVLTNLQVFRWVQGREGPISARIQCLCVRFLNSHYRR
eukprot:COSAG02_NODE_5015_length_4723_cov_3.671064_4_plen_86_part_00